MTGPMTDLMAVWPKEKDGKLWLPDIEGLPIRLDFEKIEASGILESVQYFKADRNKIFAVRSSY